MSNGQVKMANKRFSTIPHDHSLTFNIDSDIQEVHEYIVGGGTTILGSTYNFTNFQQLKDGQMKMIDLIAVVTEVQPVAQILIKSTGQMKDKRTITLVDDTGISLGATMWGELGKMDIQEGQILAVKGAGVSDYGGRSLNLSNESSMVEINPEE